MEKTKLQHTIDIFERMCNNAPPLVPEKLMRDMNVAYEQVCANPQLSEEELEQTMVGFAKKIWPYNQAFQELYKSYQAQMSEKLFLQKISGPLRRRYQEYVNLGHVFDDVQSGSAIDFFSHDERVKLHQVVVEVMCDVRQFAFQAVTHRDRERYEERVEEFQDILGHIEDQLDALRAVAGAEAEHPQLVSEINEHIRGFEHGFAFLGPQVDYRAVCESAGHFEGRKRHLKKVRVVHV